MAFCMFLCIFASIDFLWLFKVRRHFSLIDLIRAIVSRCSCSISDVNHARLQLERRCANIFCIQIFTFAVLSKAGRVVVLEFSFFSWPLHGCKFIIEWILGNRWWDNFGWRDGRCFETWSTLQCFLCPRFAGKPWQSRWIWTSMLHQAFPELAAMNVARILAIYLSIVTWRWSRSGRRCFSIHWKVLWWRKFIEGFTPKQSTWTAFWHPVESSSQFSDSEWNSFSCCGFDDDRRKCIDLVWNSLQFSEHYVYGLVSPLWRVFSWRSNFRVLYINLCCSWTASWFSIAETHFFESCINFSCSGRILTYGAAFGAGSLKPWQLWGNDSAILELQRRRPYISTSSLMIHSESVYSGNRNLIRASEVYPPGFG